MRKMLQSRTKPGVPDVLSGIVGLKIFQGVQDFQNLREFKHSNPNMRP